MVQRANGLVPVRLKINIMGGFHGVTRPQRGDVVDVESHCAARYFKTGVAQPAEAKELGEAYRPYVGAA